MKDKFQLLLNAVAQMTGVAVSELEAKLDAESDDTEFKKELGLVLNTHTGKVAAAKETNFNDGYKKAEKKVKETFEAEVKEKFGLNTAKKGLDLIEEVVSTKTPKEGELSDDVVKKHPAYLTLERDVNNRVAEAKKESETALNEFKTGVKRKEDFAVFKEDALKEFDKLNPILPENADAATKRRNTFIKSLESQTNFQLVEGGPALLLDAEGKRLDDGHGNPVPLSQHVKALADDLGFEYKAATERSSSGNGGAEGSGGTEPRKAGEFKTYKGAVPKTQAEYHELVLSDKLSDDEKVEVADYWKGQTK